MDPWVPCSISHRTGLKLPTNHWHPPLPFLGQWACGTAVLLPQTQTDLESPVTILHLPEMSSSYFWISAGFLSSRKEATIPLWQYITFKIESLPLIFKEQLQEIVMVLAAPNYLYNSLIRAFTQKIRKLSSWPFSVWRTLIHFFPLLSKVSYSWYYSYAGMQVLDSLLPSLNFELYAGTVPKFRAESLRLMNAPGRFHTCLHSLVLFLIKWLLT